MSLAQSLTEKYNSLRSEYLSARFDLINKLDDEADLSAGAIIGMAIGLIVIAAVIPSAIETFYSASTANWTINGVEDTKTTTLWWLLPFIAVAVVLYMLYSRL